MSVEPCTVRVTMGVDSLEKTTKQFIGHVAKQLSLNPLE
jgi:hypothetical protein